MSEDEDDDSLTEIEDPPGLSPDLKIYTEEEMRHQGLSIIGWEGAGLTRATKETLNGRFRDEFGANPHVIAQLWEDLQITLIPEARLDPDRRDLFQFFTALHFLKKYPTEKERNNKWKVCENYLREWGWYFVGKIQGLKRQKIRWPSDNFGNLIWAITVDGTHLRHEEIAGSDVPKDPKIFSFKHHCEGFNYEIGVSLRDSRIVWLNGPFEAGTYNDNKVFKECGLKKKLESSGKKAIADKGYEGHPTLISTPNSHDSEEVSTFKSRARLRHEKVNGKLKEFECLSARFRHGKDQLQACFEATAVIVQYKMEMGEPLYDI